MSESIGGVMRHRIPGRLRLSLDRPLPDHDRLAVLAGKLAAVEGVDEVEVRPQSGSVIVRHHGDGDAVLSRLHAAGLQIELPASDPAPADPIEQTVQRIAAVDGALRRLSGGRTDIWGLGFSLLVLTGLVQVARGRIAGPALTVLGQAATLALARPPKRSF